MLLPYTVLTLLVHFTSTIYGDTCGSSTSDKFGLWTDSSVTKHGSNDVPDAKLAYRDAEGNQKITGWVNFQNDGCNDFDGGWDYHSMFNNVNYPWDIIYLRATGIDGVVLGGIKYIGQNGNVIKTTSMGYDASANDCKANTNSFWLDGNEDSEKCEFVGIRLCGPKPIVFELSSDGQRIDYCTDAPTVSPTKTPTKYPTMCTADGLDTFDWDDLTTTGAGKPEYSDFNMVIDKNDLSLNIQVTLPFILEASAEERESREWGVTYVLDFEDINSHSASPNQPGTCSNRPGSFSTLDYNELWDERNTYVPSNQYPVNEGKWEIIDFNCVTVTYSGHFTWNELRGCKNFDQNKEYTYPDDETYPNEIRLSGVFYINVVSPYWYTSQDIGGDYYRVYQILSQPFVISVSKSVYVVGKTDINVMTMSIIAVYKEDQDTDYTLIFLTESAEYMMLQGPHLLSPAADQPQYTLNMIQQAETGDDNVAGCLNNKAYLCSQLWKIEAINTECTTNYDEQSDTGGINFSGTYRIEFEPRCRIGNGAGNNYNYEVYCNEWINGHPEFDIESNDYKGVVLESKLVFFDGICETKTFTVQLEAEMNFYEEPETLTDPIFSTEISIDNNNLDYLYQVGESTVYAEIVLNYPKNTETIFDSSLVNVWLCTFPPDTTVMPPDQNGPTNPVNQADNGGCFSSLRDGFNDANSNFFFHIYSSQTPINEEDFTEVPIANTDIIRFTFTVPNEIRRDELYVHAQVEVLLQSEEPEPLRRILLDVTVGHSANKFAHFGKNIGISNEPPKNKPAPETPPQQPYKPIQPIQPVTEPFTISLNSSWVIIIGVLLSIILVSNIIWACYMNCWKGNNGRARMSFYNNKNRRRGYDSVKHVDSEDFDDSEANLIDVNQ